MEKRQGMTEIKITPEEVRQLKSINSAYELCMGREAKGLVAIGPDRYIVIDSTLVKVVPIHKWQGKLPMVHSKHWPDRNRRDYEGMLIKFQRLNYVISNKKIQIPQL